jgi:two-component system, OmpR family, sensor histidine kinase CiaH
MTEQHKKGLYFVTFVFWTLLLYIIAALVWWFISLEKQNDRIYELKKAQVTRLDTTTSLYEKTAAAIEKEHDRNTMKYIAEGVTFLLLIIFGAAYIYRLVRRQFRLQYQQQNFMMAVTHELKTPITISRLNLETMQKHHLAEERQKKLVSATLDETLRLDTLINNILISSQLEGDQYSSSKERISLSDLVNDIVRNFKIRYPDRAVRTEIFPDIRLNGDAVLLKLLVSNLVENANKYSPREKPIVIQLSRTGQSVLLEVRDEGIGIPDDEKKIVFDKFYRVGNEQTRKTKGTGLGLFICKKIATAHHAAINILDNPAGGSRFIVSFKANQNE